MNRYKNSRNIKMAWSSINRLHYFQLAIRSSAFVVAAVFFVAGSTGIPVKIFMLVVWMVFMAEMIFRFFPSRFESMGYQKQFKRYFIPDETAKSLGKAVRERQLINVLIIAGIWILLIAGIGALYYSGVIGKAGLVLIALFFAVCDIVCILFYCPFQSLIMKNRCCLGCRIYNWDYFMMLLPLVFIKSFYTWSLVGVALLLFFRWEVSYYTHPERFSDQTNKALQCTQCSELLCKHKLPSSNTD